MNSGDSDQHLEPNAFPERHMGQHLRKSTF
jgi:hypothetical protein